MNDPQSSLDAYTVLILLIAAVAAAATVGLTYWAQASLPQALLAGGAAGGASMVWAMSVFKRPPPAIGAEKRGDDSIAG